MASDLEKFVEKMKEAMVNPELDRMKAEIKKALKEAKENPETSNIASIVLERGLIGLRTDLGELKINQNQWGSYESIFRKRFAMATDKLKNKAILESMEGKNLDAFVNDFAHFTKLYEAIEKSKKKDSKKPLKKLIQHARANAPLLAGLSAGFMAFLGLGKEDTKKKKSSKLAKAAAKADAILDKGKKKLKKKKDKKEDGGSESSDAPTPVASEGGESGPMGVGTEVESVGSVKYEVNPDYSKRLGPKEFRKKYLEIKDRQKRNMFVLQQVAAGNVNNTFEKLKVKGIEGGKGMTVEFQVDRTGLRVAGMDVQLDGPTAMTAAMLTECTLPNQWVVDQTYKAAKAKKGKVDFIDYGKIATKLGIPYEKAFKKVMKDGKVVMENGKPKTVPNGELMMSAQFAVTRDEMLRAQRKRQGVAQDAFQAGHFKSILLPSAGKGKKVAIYGARAAGSDKAIQPPGHPHYAGYSDYSHQLRRMKDKVTVTDASGKKKEMTAKEFYANQTYATEFGFKAKNHGSNITPELKEFADATMKKGDKTVAAADKPKDKKPKEDKAKKPS